MRDGGNLDHRLCDGHHGGQSPLVEAAFVHHFVQMRRGSVGVGQPEARNAGKGTAALSRDAPRVQEVQKVGQEVGQGGGRRVRQGTWGRKALVLVRVLPKGCRGSAREAQSPNRYAGARTAADVVVGLAALLAVGRQETCGGEEVRHSTVETGAAAHGRDKSWEGKAAAHRERDTGQAGALDHPSNTDPEDGRRCRRLRTDRQGNTCTG